MSAKYILVGAYAAVRSLREAEAERCMALRARVVSSAAMYVSAKYILVGAYAAARSLPDVISLSIPRAVRTKRSRKKIPKKQSAPLTTGPDTSSESPLSLDASSNKNKTPTGDREDSVAMKRRRTEADEAHGAERGKSSD